MKSTPAFESPALRPGFSTSGVGVGGVGVYDVGVGSVEAFSVRRAAAFSQAFPGASNFPGINYGGAKLVFKEINTQVRSAGFAVKDFALISSL